MALFRAVTDGLATATTKRMVAGKKPMRVTRVRITDTRRRVLAPGDEG